MNNAEHHASPAIGAGLHTIPAKEYHADPCQGPSASSGILRTILDTCPAYAYAKHPRLGVADVDDEEEQAPNKAMVIGTVAHALVLEKGDEVVVIDADSYRTKLAKELRQMAMDENKTPILAHHYEDAKAMAIPLRAAIQNYTGVPIKDCLREQVLIWEEGGLWRRIMLDLITPDLRMPVDVKTTRVSAAPMDAAKKIYTDGYHIQAAFYLRGLNRFDPENEGRREFAFIFADQTAPYLISPPITLSGEGMHLANQQVATALGIWDNCLRTDNWPGYSQLPFTASPPPYIVNRWIEQTS